MRAQWIIERKRDGEVLTDDEIGAFVFDYTQGRAPDYQMSAFAMHDRWAWFGVDRRYDRL